MESHPEGDTTEPAPPSTALENATPQEAPAGPTDPAALVNRLIEVGEWPEPELLEQIAAAGDAALAPLLDFIRTYPSPEDYQREIVLYNGIGILSIIHSPATIPDLVEIIKRYPEESGEFAAEVLGYFETAAFEPALELLRDPQFHGYRRRNAINAAKRAAGADPALRARLADILRPLLADALERTREVMKDAAAQPDEEGKESGGWVLEDLEEGDLEELSDEAIEPDDDTAEGSKPDELEAYEEAHVPDYRPGRARRSPGAGPDRHSVPGGSGRDVLGRQEIHRRILQQGRGGAPSATRLARRVSCSIQGSY